jgi:hypothetical protein
MSWKIVHTHVHLCVCVCVCVYVCVSEREILPYVWMHSVVFDFEGRI